VYLTRRATQLINNLRLYKVVQPYYKLRDAVITTLERSLSFRTRELYYPTETKIFKLVENKVVINKLGNSCYLRELCVKVFYSVSNTLANANA
jgi:hypothetical protein